MKAEPESDLGFRVQVQVLGANSEIKDISVAKPFEAFTLPFACSHKLIVLKDHKEETPKPEPQHPKALKPEPLNPSSLKSQILRR